MKETRSIVGAMLCATLLLGGCGLRVITGSGHVITESRPVSNFSEVKLSGAGEITLIQGETESLTIETDDNLLPYLNTTVSNGTLNIDFTGTPVVPMLRPTQSIRYRLTVKTLDALELSGAGNIVSDKLAVDHLTLTESGAGQIKLNQLSATDLAVHMSGAGMIDLTGKVVRQTVELSGLGNYQAGNLASQTAKVDLSGAGAATVWASEHLDTNLSGAGNINYYGSPQTNTESSGIGKLRSLGDK